MGQQEAKPLSGADWSKEHVPDVPDVVLSVFFEGTGIACGKNKDQERKTPESALTFHPLVWTSPCPGFSAL
eukprot:5787336-Amphidinium_carterae.1